MFATLAVAFILALVRGEWISAFLTVSILGLMFIPNLIEARSAIFIPRTFAVAFAFFIYATLFLGELNDFYNHFWWWDIALHSGSGLGFGILGLILLLTLVVREKVSASPFTLAFFAFCFAMALAGIWEILEFAMDGFFSLNMQKSGLVDTMTDLVIDAAGAVIGAGLGYFYLVSRHRGPLGIAIEEAVRNNMPKAAKGRLSLRRRSDDTMATK